MTALVLRILNLNILVIFSEIIFKIHCIRKEIIVGFKMSVVYFRHVGHLQIFLSNGHLLIENKKEEKVKNNLIKNLTRKLSYVFKANLKFHICTRGK